MGHSNQIRSLQITNAGIKIGDMDLDKYPTPQL
jgi:hypothetical protein